jgi:glucokinase
MLLVGDIGGTKTDLAVFTPEEGPWNAIARKRFPSADYPSLEAITTEFVAELDCPVAQACFAVAGPVRSGKASLTNLPWVVDESVLRATLQIDLVRLLNDVEAMAAAVPYLRPADVRTLQSGEPEPGGAVAVIAAGTGLGEAYLVWDGLRYVAHASEGSHNDFGATSEHETELLRYLQRRWGRVSYERVCAGQSIPDLYDFLRAEGHAPESDVMRAQLATVRDRTPPIVAAALDANAPDPLCLAAVNMFASTLGAEAGNLALTVLATGGLYVAGGMAQRILPVATEPRELFMTSFNRKGRLSPLLSRVPVHLIVESVALLGAAMYGFELTRSAGNTAA